MGINQMQVFYDYQIFCLQKHGGISRYIYEIASRINKIEEFQVKILAFAHINAYLKECNSEILAGFSVPSLPKSSKILEKINHELMKYYVSNKHPDIVHETYYSHQKVAPRSKTVVTVHDMIHEKFNSLFAQRHRHLVKTKAAAIRRAERVICVSENTKKDLLEILDINPERVSVIHHGCSLQLSNNFQLSKRILLHPYILYVGQREGYKNFQRLLKAYSNSPKLNENFVLACFGGGAFSPEELILMNELKLPEGKVMQINGDDNTLANLYSQASAFVYPSLYEGFGIPLLEAMLFSCPVVCSNSSSIPEVVGCAAEFFDPYEPESITNALENVLYLSDKAKSLVKFGTERVKNFSWDICAEKTRSVYLSLL